MGKYYVISGELKVIVAGSHVMCPRQAACEALLMFKGCRLSPLILVSERGFDINKHGDNEDVVLTTKIIAEEAGLLNEGNEQ